MTNDDTGVGPAPPETIALWVGLVAMMGPDELDDFERSTLAAWDRASLGDLRIAIQRRRRELALGKHDDPNPRRQSRRRHRPDRGLTTTPPATPSVRAGQGSAAICVLLGLLFMLVSVYFLVVAPSEGSTEFLGRTLAVTRLQRLAIGQTSSIIGAIYLAAGFRRR